MINPALSKIKFNKLKTAYPNSNKNPMFGNELKMGQSLGISADHTICQCIFNHALCLFAILNVRE